ncbi:MAG: metallopeptidase family protein [Azospirillaceae bacterium]|nr:metallopeptidase family protein [Azospirillaceae bacterium]
MATVTVLPRRFTSPPTLEEIERLANDAITAIPPELRVHIGNVVVRVEEFPDEETEREMGLETPFDILGLYRGVSLPQRGVNDANHGPDMIFIYRRPLLDYWCETGEELGDLVLHVMIHEIGHHFGFSDDDMFGIEANDP